MNEKIIDMFCGENDSILLTENGKVYELKHRNGCLKHINNNNFKNEKIVMISCGERHTLALTESGRVFGWGSNRSGQLGVDVDMDSSEPINIQLNDLKIKKINCGPLHSLLLSCDGDIYAFGSNTKGQIGNQTLEQQRKPIKLETNNKFIDIATHPYNNISMSQSIDGIYYVWGYIGGNFVLSPRPTRCQSFEDILRCDNAIYFQKFIGNPDSFVRNGYYKKMFEEVSKVASGTFGTVFKVKCKENDSDSTEADSNIMGRVNEIESPNYKAIKKIYFDIGKKSEIIREHLNYSIISQRLFLQNLYLTKHFDAWFEEIIYENEQKISFFIEMELCEKKLDDVINEFEKDSHFKTNGTLTSIGYYIASQLFIEMLEGVNFLHTQNPSLIHRDLHPLNILLKKCDSKGFSVKIADFGLMTQHEFSEQTHSLDKGKPKYTAPEVINNQIYNTKADIYSLGIIFRNLFDLEINESYDDKQNISIILKSKFNKSIELFEEMTTELPHKRPDCVKILFGNKSWALFEEELEINDEMKNTILTKIRTNDSTIYPMLKSRLLSDK